MKLKYLIVICLSVGLFSSCEQEEELVKPTACFTLDKTTAGIFEAITVTNCSSEADYYALWQGEDGSNYEIYISDEYKDREEAKDSQSGVQIGTEETSILYSSPGTYTVYLVARSISKWNAEEIVESVTSQQIVIE